MRISILFFLVTATFSCVNNSTTNHTAANDFSFENLIGKWQVDSSTQRNFDYSDIYITPEKKFYFFLVRDGGGLAYHGILEGDSARTQHEMSFAVNQTDSNRIELSYEYSDEKLFLRRREYGPFLEDLEDAIKADSLRNQLLGWWKLSKTNRSYLKLPNNSDKPLSTFTLQINKNGEAIFYHDHQLDSIVTYSYSIGEDEINVLHGCVMSSISILKISEDSCTIFNSRLGFNELVLTRIREIK